MAARLAWSALKKMVKKHCLAAWDMENTGVPKCLLGSLSGMVSRIKTNFSNAGFGPHIWIAAFGNHKYSVGKKVVDSFKQQRLHVTNTSFKEADNYVAGLVDHWKRIHPQGSFIVLFSADRNLAELCSKGSPLFKFYLAATPDSVAKDYFDHVKPLGGWVWPKLLSRRATMYPTEALKEFEHLNKMGSST